MSAYFAVTLYRDDTIVYQGNDWYEVDMLLRIGDRITTPCGVNVTYLGGYDDSDDETATYLGGYNDSDDETTVGSLTENDDEHDED